MPSTRRDRALIRGLLVAGLLVAACSSPSATPVRIGGAGCGVDLVGSGLVVSDDSILTNAHVVAGAEDVWVAEPGGERIPASIVAFDPVRDLALLAAPGLTGTIEIGSPSDGLAGTVLATNAAGELTELEFVVRREITALSGDIYERGDHARQALELLADIGPGDSGAAVVADSGELLGLVFASSVTSDGVAYAVAGSEIAAFLADPPRSPADECP